MATGGHTVPYSRIVLARKGVCLHLGLTIPCACSYNTAVGLPSEAQLRCCIAYSLDCSVVATPSLLRAVVIATAAKGCCAVVLCVVSWCHWSSHAYKGAYIWHCALADPGQLLQLMSVHVAAYCWIRSHSTGAPHSAIDLLCLAWVGPAGQRSCAGWGPALWAGHRYCLHVHIWP